MDLEIEREVQRRRTFAIISHPDAGKTTLTEKLLLFGGCIDVAGAVRGRKSQRGARSDWLELEKQRGISVSSTVLTFEFEGHQVNLLDTPGHHDFSEDTYRTLMAADCAVMVIDLAKGIETQTEKLFRVCALRGIPVITFVNKADRPGRSPLAILAEIETKFGIDAIPRNWPLGTGADFTGVIDVEARVAHVFDERDANRRIAYRSVPLDELAAAGEHGAEIVTGALEDVELLEAAGIPFERERFLAGRLTPVFFGSALTNFGVEHFLRGFLELCPSPQARQSDVGRIAPARPQFAGFVFKIQANLDPRHRDRIAFVRVCAGRFRRDMEVLHARTGKTLRLRRAHRVFGQERETMDEAFPGDIIGLVNPGEFRLGDTICEGTAVNFEPLPQFSPENFAVLRCRDSARRKQFHRGLEQLLEEGAIQAFSDARAARREPLLAAVGELQFDVVRFRLESEYDTATDIEWLPYKLTRWIDADPNQLRELRLPYSAKFVRDQIGHPAVLFQSKWDAELAERDNPDVRFMPVRMTSAPVDSSGQPTPAW
ncbi:MAG: peptide chain release factor 3 [Pirellulaceae bacterium]|nr:peptide chain release factor 3 [Pirellulaceae bacterium]